MIYLDNAATEKTKMIIVDSMLDYYNKYYANPSSIYSISNDSKNGILESRNKISELIKSYPEEIYFTSGGTESDNWIIKSIALNNPNSHIITSSIEHDAIINSCKWLEEKGYAEVTYLDPDSDGIIKINDILKSIKENTILVSIMMANNEIGTIQNITDIGKNLKKKNILFHTDAVQAVGHIPIDVTEMNIDLLSASGHKFGAPKGIGFLYIRNGIELKPLIHGGGQEKNMRSGTENVPAIAGLGQAASLANKFLDDNNQKMTYLRDYFIDNIFSSIKNIKLNGSKEHRLPSNINILFRDIISGEALLSLLNEHEIYVSTGSACASNSGETSHVLKAIGLTPEEANKCIRFTLSSDTTKEDIDYVIEKLKECVCILGGELY